MTAAGLFPSAISPSTCPARALPARRQARHFTTLDQVTQLVEARDADPEMGFMARLLALCALPRTNPGKWLQFKRVNGPYTLYLVAGGGNKLALLEFVWVTLPGSRGVDATRRPRGGKDR